MTTCLHQKRFFRRRNRRQDKWKRELEKLARWRKLKAEKRQRLVDAGIITREPKMQRWYRFEIGVRDNLTGETHFVVLKSVRDASKRIGLVLKYCQ